MKTMTYSASCRHVPMACALLGTLFLQGCGSGGSSTAPAPAPVPVVLLKLSEVVAPSDFTWSTQVEVAPKITLSAVSSPAESIPGLAAIDVTDLSVLISNYTCIDPTGGTAPLSTPLRTSQLATLPYITLTLAGLTNLKIPTATVDVLVEIVDGNSILHSEILTPAKLSSLTVGSLDKTKPTLAACR